MATNRRIRRPLILATVVCVGLVSVVAAVLAQSGPPPSASGTGQSGNTIITFGASMHTDNTGKPFVNGVAQQHDTVSGSKITIDINCLQVDGNQAWMSGPVVHAHLANVKLGIDMAFIVEDNGEPNDDASPDRFTPFTFGTCQKLPALKILQSERGNIQVRGSGGGGGDVCPIGTFQCPGCPPGVCAAPGEECKKCVAQ